LESPQLHLGILLSPELALLGQDGYPAIQRYRKIKSALQAMPAFHQRQSDIN
jgi:hypothetical protein